MDKKRLEVAINISLLIAGYAIIAIGLTKFVQDSFLSFILCLFIILIVYYFVLKQAESQFNKLKKND